MKNIYYKSSEGVIINLIETPYRMLTETDVFNWEWQYEQAGTNYPYITAFKNQMVSKAISVRVSGATEEAFYNNLEHFVEVVDRDVRLNQVGRLYCGDYFIECFITGVKKGKVFKKKSTTIEATILAENGDWKSIQDSSYTGLSGGVYLNQYAVPSVSSNETNYSYGTNADTEGTVYVYEDEYRTVNIGSADTFHIESLQSAIKYKLPSDNSYTTINPSDCPYDIDLSNVPYYVEYNNGMKKNRLPLRIEI